MSPASGLLSVDEARDAVLTVTAAVGTERIAAAASLGRITADEVTALVSLPPWPNSAMDGYAIQAADTHAAQVDDPVELRVIGDVRAGVASDVRVVPGSAVRIATGARLPEGADAVVPVEATTPVDGAGMAGVRGRDAQGPLPTACLVHEVVQAGGSVRASASDLQAGAVLLQAGSGITAAAVTLIAGAGVEQLVVHRLPRIGVLATGDEVRAPGAPLGQAGIPDANGPGLRALVVAAGADAIDLGIALTIWTTSSHAFGLV